MSEAATRLSRDLQVIARDLSQAIERSAGEPIAFTLLVFTPGCASYVSSTNREDSVRKVKNLLAYWDAGAPDIPAHDYNS